MSTDAINQGSRFAPLTNETSAPSATSCSACNAPLRGSYHLVDDAVTCANCRYAAEAKHGSGGFGRAFLFGAGAAIVGAIGYYVFVRVTGMEWGLITAFVGIGVGQAVRAGSRARGGRKFQVLALVLAYLAMGGAYLPFGAEGFMEGLKNGRNAAATSTATQQAPATAAPASGDLLSSDSAAATAEESDAGDPATTPAATPAPAPHTAASPKVAGGIIALGIAMLLVGGVLALFAMPVIVAVTSPLSGLIMCFALIRAWKQNAGVATELRVAGPFRLGTPPSAA